MRYQARVEDVDYRAPRGLDRALFLKLMSNDWIRKHRNCLVVGPTGVGKTWLCCALGDKACREDFSVAYHRVPRLFTALSMAHGDGRYAKLLRALSRVDLLILDDWGPEVLTAQQRRDLLEIVEDRYNTRSLLITSQIPVKQWYDISRTRQGTPVLERVISEVTVIDPHHALFGRPLQLVSLSAARGRDLLTVALPDGRQRTLRRSITDLDEQYQAGGSLVELRFRFER